MINFHYWKKIDSLHHHNRLLLAFVLILSLIVLSLVITIATMPKRYQFWLTPQMAANGGLVKANDIPKEYVQGFVSLLLPTLYSWEPESHDFKHNMASFHYYFTPRHEARLKQSFNDYQKAQLFNRAQIASLYQFMAPHDVKKIAPNVWQVTIYLRITQRFKDDHSMVIADKVVRYSLRVVKVNLSKLQNPFQLALDGYTKPEVRIKDLLLEEKKAYAS